MRSVSVKVLALCAVGASLSSCAGASAATLSATTPSASPRGQWVTESFHGAGLVVTVDHPVAWTSQLQPLSIHYSATFGYLANFPLHQFCRHPTSSSFECTWADAGPVPMGGILVTFGVEGYGPGPDIAAQLLSQGAPTTVDGHRAALQTGNGSGCLGTGAAHNDTYFVDDGPTGGVFDISFCWLGNSSTLADDVHTVTSRLTLRPDPTNSGPFPG
jgi:hypothetical protein